jgi:hypothetical protein
MPEIRTYHDEEIVNVETRHETSDVNVKALLSFVVVFILFAIVTHIVLYLLFGYYRGIFRGHTNAPLTAIDRPARAAIPPEPRLQPFKSADSHGADVPPTAVTPVLDMETMRHNEDEAQTNAGWIDQAHGRVRLPIDVAKQLVVQRGLPVNTSANTSPSPATAGGSAAAPAAPQTQTTPAATQPTPAQTQTAAPAEPQQKVHHP